MIIRCANNAIQVDQTIVATDSEKIGDVCDQHGISWVMTRADHQSGTDRVHEAIGHLELPENEIIINLQGDEPFLETRVVRQLQERMKTALAENENVFMTSCYKQITEEEAESPHTVKVVLNRSHDALYFSRSLIPHDRAEGGQPFFGHIGIYGFYARSLKEFCSLPEGIFEHREKLEQLRALEAGKKIAMIEVKSNSFGIDTPDDLERAIQKFL